MAVLHKKLERLKMFLKDFNASHFTGISNKVKAKMRELDAIQLLILSNNATVKITG